jgi:hypothetical protein
MRKRLSKGEGKRDFMEIAKAVVDAATSDDDPAEDKGQPETEDGKTPAAVALGRLGGKKGGKARAEKLTPEQRSEIARKAAAARWKSQKK